LADQLGTVREVVSRILHTFEQRRLVALSRGQVRVLRPTALEGVAAGEKMTR
jgi:CRP/FNR family transcriptional regulator